MVALRGKAMGSREWIFWDVDTQRDFMLPGGKLYVPGAEKLIPNLKRLVDLASDGSVFLVSTVDAHTPNDPEFRNWPPHCVQGTPGQQKIPETLTDDFLVVPNDPEFRLPEDLRTHKQIIVEKQTLDDFDEVRAQGRFTASQPKLAESHRDGGTNHALDFLGCEKFGVRHELQAVDRHAIHTPQIAAIDQRDSQVVDFAVEGIPGHFPIFHAFPGRSCISVPNDAGDSA